MLIRRNTRKFPNTAHAIALNTPIATIHESISGTQVMAVHLPG
jgi:hypothetical protein